MKERDLCSCFHSPVFLHSYTYYQFLKQPDTVTDTRTVTRTKIHRINSILRYSILFKVSAANIHNENGKFKQKSKIVHIKYKTFYCSVC